MLFKRLDAEFPLSFKTTDVANMMDSDLNQADDADLDTGSAKGTAEHESNYSAEHDAEDVLLTAVGYSRPSMRGLQQVLAQGWLIQRARDMCSFTHDKYRQAATHMASQQPDIVIMRMCLKVGPPLFQNPCTECLFFIGRYPSYAGESCLSFFSHILTRNRNLNAMSFV